MYSNILSTQNYKYLVGNCFQNCMLLPKEPVKEILKYIEKIMQIEEVLKCKFFNKRKSYVQVNIDLYKHNSCHNTSIEWRKCK